MRISDWSSDVCSSDLVGEIVSETGVEIAIAGDRLQGRSTQVDIDGPCESEIARVGKIDTCAVTTVAAPGNEAVIDRKPTIGGIGVRVLAVASRAAARTRATAAAATHPHAHCVPHAHDTCLDAGQR